MPRITGRSNASTTTEPSSPPEPAAAAAAANRSEVPPGFVDGIEPRPAPATTWAANFYGSGRYRTVEIDPATGTGGPGLSFAEAGKPFLVHYSRGPSDVGGTGEAKKVELFYRIDDGDIRSAVVGETRDMRSGYAMRSPVRIDIPADARGELEYWFRLETASGEVLWDSDFGKNFRADILPAGGAVLRFDELWNEAVSGPIRAGETLRLAYDTDRLKQFLRSTTTRGAQTWNVSAFVSFDGKPAQELPITVPRRGDAGTYSELVTLEAAVEVPADAREVSVWFRGSSYGGSVHPEGGAAWDSNMSANYVFAVEGDD